MKYDRILGTSMESTYKTILENVLAGYWDWNITQDTEYFSPSLKTMLGYEDNELNNRLTRKSLIFPEDQGVVEKNFFKHIASFGKTPYCSEVRYIHKNGTLIWIKSTGQVIEWDTNGAPIRMVGCHIDITQQKNTESQLRQTENLLYQTNLTARVGGWETNMITGKVIWSKVINDIYEMPDDFEPGQNHILEFCIDGENKELLKKAIEESEKSGKSYDIELQIVTALGKKIWVRAIGHSEFKNGKCIRLYGSLQDIDREKKILQELQISEERFRGAFEYSAIGMSITSSNGRWLKVNKKLAQLLGYSQEELLLKSFQEVTHADDLEKNLELLRKILRGDLQAYQMEKRFIHKTGKIIWALISVSLVKDTEGNPLHLISQIEDITERKKAHDTISNQNSRLLNFAHIVSHNLRSHAGNIKMLIDLVCDPVTETDEKEELLHHLKAVSNQLNETIDHLNDVVSVKTCDDLQKEKVNLHCYVNKTINILSADIIGNKIKVINDVDPGTELNCNPAYLESIILNLVTNGIKYRDRAKKPRISIGCDIKNEQYLLTITDNGIGIDLQKHGDKLFGMYKTFHGNSDAKGIGLFITKNQVEAMGGKIEVESKVGSGTSFKIYF